MFKFKGRKWICQGAGDLRRIIGKPVVSLHAATRYAQRVLGIETTEETMRKNKPLLERCRNGIRRIYKQADQLVLAINEPAAAYLVCRNRCLVVKSGRIVTVIMKAHRGSFSKAKLGRYSRGRLPGIERFNALLAFGES